MYQQFLGKIQVPDDFIEAGPQILIPQVPTVSVAEENELEDEYEVEEDGYGVDEEEEDTNLMKLNQNEQFANEVV